MFVFFVSEMWGGEKNSLVDDEEGVGDDSPAAAGGGEKASGCGDGVEVLGEIDICFNCLQVQCECLRLLAAILGL